MIYSAVIFKNDKIGDIIHSFLAIKKIIDNSKGKKVLIYLSNLNSEIKFLFNYPNVEFKVVSEKLSLIEKINIIIFFLFNKVNDTYILKPSNFLFFLPFILYFKKLKFNGICINKVKYSRPSKFFRNFLNRYEINDRGTKKIRKSIMNLYLDLIENRKDNNKLLSYDFKFKNNIINDLPNDYILFHYNKLKFDYLGWNIEDLNSILKNINKIEKKIILTNDINDNKTNNILAEKYKDSNVIYLPNIKGKDFFDVIGNSKLVIALHGMITAIGAIQNIKVLDLFYCNIENINDFYKYKNSFHEFKPKKDNYEFIIPKKNINKTIIKINHIINHGRKINY